MWQKKDNSLYRKFEFKDFDEALDFIDKIADIARAQNHHPKIINNYNVVELWLSTHSAGNVVTDKDESFAREVDALLNERSQPQKPKVNEAHLYTDGGARGNPGPAALGYVIYDADGSIVEKNSRYLGATTNNQAEYQALKEGLEASKKLGVKKLDVFMDSLLVVNQLKGLYKVKNKDLAQIHKAINQLASEFESVSFKHVPREQNSVADSMVNECLDAAGKAGV
jgi:ribonuclease HI/pterin-4a-carbinolamine dehydratase